MKAIDVVIIATQPAVPQQSDDPGQDQIQRSRTPLPVPILNPVISKRRKPGWESRGSEISTASIVPPPLPLLKTKKILSSSKTDPIKKTTTVAQSPAAMPQIRVDVDGQEEWVDPNEARYCVCGDVSWGVMICCELDEKCDFGQWFHLECVSLYELPPRTVKYYCPGEWKQHRKGEMPNGLVGGIKELYNIAEPSSSTWFSCSQEGWKNDIVVWG